MNELNQNQIPPEPRMFSDEWCEWKRKYFAAELEDFYADQKEKTHGIPKPVPTIPASASAEIDLHPLARYGFLGRFLARIEPVTEVRVGTSALLVLTAIGNQFGHTAWTIVETKIDGHGHKQYPNLFMATVGRSGKGRKGTSWNLIKSALKAALRQLWNEKWTMSMSSGEGIIHNVRDERKEMKTDRKGVTTLRTVDHGVKDKRKIVLLQEMVLMFKLASRAGNIVLDVIRDACDGNNLSNPTKNSEEYATDPHISMISHTTVDDLMDNIGDNDVTNGVLNRYLWVWATRNKKLARGGNVSMEDLVPELQEILKFKPGEVPLSKAAEPVWDAMYEYLNPDDDYDSIPVVDSILSRGDMWVIRLALIFALLDRSYFIEPRHLQAAWAIWVLSDESARKIFGVSIKDTIANKLVEMLREKDMTAAEVYNVFKRNVSEYELKRAIKKLPKGCITTREIPMESKPITVYHLNPDIQISQYPKAIDAPFLKAHYPDVAPGKNPYDVEVPF